jgi:NAD(P)-dependent dehydrogenase (short-subunit alcohol dehydrogenase family)
MYNVNFDISGQVAVITGAGGIICGTMAKEMAKKGVKIALLDLFVESAQKIADEINANGGEAKLTIYAGGLHNAWTDTFRNPEVWKWLLGYRVDYVTAKSKYDNVEQFG